MAGVLALLLLSAVSLQAQQPSYQLNEQAVNPKAGVALAQLQQLEQVLLSLDSPDPVTSDDSLVVYLARGNRPLAKQQMALGQYQQMDIRRLVLSATEGDRLVLELIRSEGREELSVVTLVLH